MQDTISYTIPTHNPPNPTQRAIDSVIRLHSPSLSEIAFALSILDIAAIKLDSYNSYKIQDVRDRLADHLEGEIPPEKTESLSTLYTEAEIYGLPNHTSESPNPAA